MGLLSEARSPVNVAGLTCELDGDARAAAVLDTVLVHLGKRSAP
jgi:hypothetical protein